MTATVAHPKSILVTSRCSSRYSDDRSSPIKASSGSNSCNITMTMAGPSPVLLTGKLKNLRNYYARRRPTLKPPTPVLIVSSPESTRVRFRPRVFIREIPNRKDYSKADKRAIWMPRQELKKLILKNHTEFSFEGRDWRNAPEEDQFGTDEDGQLLHPVHLALKKKKRAPQPQQVSAASTPCSSSTAVIPSLAPRKRKSNAVAGKNRRCLRRLPLSYQNTNAAVIEDDEETSDEEEEELVPELKRARIQPAC